ncbi:MAG: GIY-YIG nuclease family protein [Anaerolineales bacterium]
MLKHIPKLSGVYQIRCACNDKIYIGSAVNMDDRCEHHRSSLRRGDHPNPHLQAAWDKYREENFEFMALETVNRIDLLYAEQNWLDKTQSYARGIGFNIFDTAGSPGDMFAQIWEGFVDPDGNEVTIQNLFGFCRQNNLDFPSMHRLSKGESKLKSYKGWSHKNSVRQRDYIKTYNDFIDPNGSRVGPITNLAAFCRENNLDNTHMVAVANGRLYSHRGWTYQNDRENHGIKTYTRFIDPDGNRVVITNLEAFCRENKLEVVHMRELISGKRKSHKGWRWDAGYE